ncbi:MAG: hypothetical protein FJ112_03160 [Deltaproteobacteria bacterium]|nr:hypothetical protein [Deltaproteobacteria bacterium]
MQIQLKPISSISWVSLGVYSFAVFLAQIIQGTSVAFASNILMFHLLCGMAFNFSGGGTTVFGWLIGLLSLRQVIISQWFKMFSWQPADQGLSSPEVTSQVYVLGMGMIVLVTLVDRYFRFERYPIVKEDSFYFSPRLVEWLFVGSLILNFYTSKRDSFSLILAPLLNALSYLGGLGILALIAELNRTAWETKGKKLFNIRSVVILSVLFALGVLGTSKQGMFEPLFAVLVVAIFQKIKIGIKSIATIAFIGLLMVFVFTPLSDDGRNYIKRDQTLGVKVESLGNYLKENFSSFEGYSQYLRRLREQTIQRYSGESLYTSESTLLIERFSLISAADKLIHYYNNNEKEGYSFFWSQIYLLPRSLTGKWLFLDTVKGSVMARKIGMISDDDDVTGISFGSFAEAFAIDGFWGVVWIVFIVFLSIRIGLSLIDVRGPNRFWSMWLILALHHNISEVGVLGCCLVAVRTIPFLFVVKKLMEVIESLYLSGLASNHRKGHSH